MRKSLLPAFLVLAAAPNASAQDHDHPYYLDLGVGLVAPVSADPPGASGEVDFDLGYSTSLAVGRPFGHTGSFEWALEGELYYTYFNLDEGDLDNFPGAESAGSSAFAVMANLVAGTEVATGLDFFVGGGIGYAPNIEYKAFGSGNLRQRDDSGIAGQFMVGLAYDLGRESNVGLGYRFFATETVEVDDQVSTTSDDVDFMTHSFELSFRWGI